MQMDPSTTLSLDHIVILVGDLSAASADYAALGFTVVPGGEHADGRSHNALIAFADGSYLELISFRGPVPESHPFYRPGMVEGLVTYALLPNDIARVVAEAGERGLALNGPTPGGRLRPDGQRIAWQTARPATHDLPFLCADVTPRELRVPRGPAARHDNGILGVAGITITVLDLRASIERYRALLGTDPLPVGSSPAPNTSTFRLRNTLMHLTQPLDELEREPPSQHEGPYSVAFDAIVGAPTGPLDTDLAHGARMEIVERETQ
jgi:catechol 2,3-dioxygenase-like lactoylglutathione lyase family enzyme